MLPQAEQDKIAAFLKGKHICKGLGSREEACSIAAINLALYGRLVDTIPECMSEVIGHWIIIVQDAMPDEMRNSREWRVLLPLAAGTGQEKERERLAIILVWMWECLNYLQPVADKDGYGKEWAHMCKEKTAAATRTATAATYAVADATAAAAATATRAATRAAATRAADAATYAAAATAAAARAIATTTAAARAATAAATAADAATYATATATRAAAIWEKFNPIQLLNKLVQ